MHEQKKTHFANAFAANDPVSTKILWDKLCHKYGHCDQRILIVNCRADREDRSAQMARAIIEWDSPSKIILIGTGTGIFEHYYEKDCAKKNITPCLLITCEGLTPTKIINQATHTKNHDQEFILVGVRNIAGIGLKLIDFCQDGHHQYKENA